MTDLSPAAQAIKEAVLLAYKTNPEPSLGWTDDVPIIAAALRAAADQIIEETSPVEELLAIAAELEGFN